MSDYYDEYSDAADAWAEHAWEREENARLEAEECACVEDLPAETLAMLDRVRALNPALADEMGQALAVQYYLDCKDHAERVARERRITEARVRVERAEAYIGQVHRRYADDPDYGEREVNAAVRDKCRAEDELLAARDPDAYAEAVYFYGKSNGVIGG